MNELPPPQKGTRIKEHLLVAYHLCLGRQKLARRKRRRLAKEQFDHVLNTTPADAIAIDCGANHGHFTRLFLNKGMRVHAFEPDPVAVASFRTNIGEHKDLTFNPVAVGVRHGSARLFRTAGFETSPEEKTVSSSLLDRSDGDRENFVDVEIINLLEYIENIPERIAILKIDIEGAEVELLEELLRTGLHRKIDLIFVETHERISFKIALRTSRLRANIHSRQLSHINLDHN